MKTELWVIGKTNEKYLETGTQLYLKRIKHYLPFKIQVLPAIKKSGKMAADQLKIKEGELILQKLQTDDFLILLDERGRLFSSEGFAEYLQHKLQSPYRRVIFLVGGAWGFSEALYHRANEQLALSQMTFSHQMVRLFFLEQLYRAMTILRNEPYHNA